MPSILGLAPLAVSAPGLAASAPAARLAPVLPAAQGQVQAVVPTSSRLPQRALERGGKDHVRRDHAIPDEIPHPPARSEVSTTVNTMAIAMMVPAISHTSVAHPIQASHVRHRPRSARKLTSGTRSYQLNLRPQASQRDRPLNEAPSPREATTPAKDPTAPPHSPAKITISASNEVGPGGWPSESRAGR